MTGHAHDNQREPKHGQAGLDALVTQIRKDRQGRNPHLVPLEGYEAEIINLFTREYPGHGYRDAGITLLVLGQLLVDWVTKMPEAMQRQAPALIINMMRMIGQRLYDGDLPPIGVTCPFHYVHGAKCKYLAEGADTTRIDAAMRAHVGLHHPDNEWPCEHRERITEDGVTAMCTACREVVPAVVGELECEPDGPKIELHANPTLPPGVELRTYAEAAADPDDIPPMGKCPECGNVVFLEDCGVIADHPDSREHPEQAPAMRRCTGYGRQPVTDA
jgi:hypothetical protein